MNFEVNRQDFRTTQTVDGPTGPGATELGQGQVRLSVERFAFTTNNITYAVAGDMLDYWGFFPAESPWGRIPAMGLGSVTETNNPDIETGGRYFGFYPMADEVVITAKARRNGFRDIGAHRAEHAAVYTDFNDVSNDAMFRHDRVDEYLLLRGMFTTSFLVDDFLADADFHGATQVLVTSASSKTSISLAHCLARRRNDPGGAAPSSVGLTSDRNRAFVEALGLYDQVITYDEVNQLDPTTPSVVVDMAGNAAVRHSVHSHFGDQLRFSSMVGATHWEDQTGPAEALPGATPEFFFAPAQIAKRTAEWGAEELTARMAGSLHALLDDTPSWLTVAQHFGPTGVAEVHDNLLEGRADPSTGYIVSLSRDELG